MNPLPPLQDLFKEWNSFLKTKECASLPPWFDSLLEIFAQNVMPMGVTAPTLRKSIAQDYIVLDTFKKNIIEGYLNLSKAQGWHEGHDLRIGIVFVRYILIHYFAQRKSELGANTQVLEKAIKAFTSSKPLLSFVLQEKKPKKNHPKISRLRYDISVFGWQNHGISRLVGNVGSAFRLTAPFFEILVNSSRDSAEKTSCQPFHISVFKNGGEIDERQKALRNCKTIPELLARFTFYSHHLQKPDGFLKRHQKQLGPNSTRLLRGLDFLQKVTINAQTVGNCWMKQPMRALLATLYVEVLTQKPQLSLEQTWEEAKTLYKDIQKKEAILLVQSFLNQVTITETMRRAALESIEHLKKL